jgi:2-oxo-4-hydroxy-4-carboxy-5-ureidoimidazoline decarboxylase
MSPIDLINRLDQDRLSKELFRCCGCKAWVRGMMLQTPFTSEEDLLKKSDDIWWTLTGKDWLESFLAHPRIGDMDSLRNKYNTHKPSGFESEEQSGANSASEAVLQGLAQGNADYEARFGHIFLICATGKSAEEMLSSLHERYKNDSNTEVNSYKYY